MTFVNRLPADLVICGNGSLVYSIFRNLTDNAIAYAGIGTTITLTAQFVQTNIEDNGKWHFCFSDNGVGVAPEHLQRLFERFYRVDDASTEGSGLGLYIVKTILDNHKENISVTSENGVTEFTFTLTLA